ncbi:MAG: hypothetical protein HYV03_05255 [Deltaproteobacteria bacterium]|nr:hypothetical protein [Deltaproteobacteria bacterium]
MNATENKALLAKVPAEILEPRRFFEANGRAEQYRGWVAKMKTERRAFLEKYGVDAAIIRAVENVPA